MSSVDERVVKMVFDNSEFSDKISATLRSLKQLNQSTNQIANNTGGLSAMGEAFSQCEALATKAGFQIRDVWTKVANIFEQQIASKIVNTSKQIANAMTFEGISDGFKEYELKMGSIQTIMAGTGESLQTVNKYLDELNTYSDKTIYSFADMTNNIGKFTNAGVKLEDAVAAIKGIANEAALSGANANEASRAMYNFSQALSAGYVKLIDWKSIENANMATKGFKDTLLEVASVVGTVKKEGDGMYKVLTTNAQGRTMDELVSGTKNFNDSLQQQWMTTEVLTKALKLYANDLTEMTEAEKEAFRQDLGMDEEQFKQFEELGHKATLAASEVKTFTMLMDTLKEAIGSGWAMTWQMVIGDFNQAKELWTEVANILGGVIDAQSSYRNDTLKLWQNAGGRTDVINAMRNSFEAIQAILKPLSEGLRDVFPKYTYRTLKDISEALSNFTAKLKITEETATKVRHVTRGFFSVFDIGLQIVKGFIKAIVPMSDGVSGFASGLLDAATSVGDFLYNLDQTLKRSNFFEKTFKNIGETIKPIFDVLTSGASGILKFFSGLFSKFADSAKSVKLTGDTFKEMGESVSSGIDKIKEKLSGLSPMFQGLLTFVKGVGSVLGGVFKQIGGSLSAIGTSSNPLGNMFALLTGAFAGGTIFKIFKSVESLSSVTEIFEGVGEVLEGFQKNLKAGALIKIATAIGIMAASLAIVASIDSKKLLGATTAISAMVFSLAGAMVLLLKAVNSFSTVNVSKKFSLFGKNIFGFDTVQMLKTAVTLKAVGSALIAMGAAVALMAVGLRIVSKAAEGGHLWDSFAVVSLMLAELTGVAVVLGKWGGKASKGAKSLIAMTTALVIMAEALKIVSGIVASGNALPALGIITVMLAELTLVAIALGKFSKFGIGAVSSAVAVIAITASLNLMVLALKQVSDLIGKDGGMQILKALGVISLLLAELTAATVVMSKFGALGALGGVGAVLAAASLLIMVQAIKQVSDMLGQTNQHVWQALGVIGVALTVLAVGMTAMVAAVPGAAALLIASAALVILGGALKIIGSMSVGEIAKSLITLTLALAVLAAGLTLMLIALPGAVALTVAAAGLTVLAGALKIFGKMKLGAIVKSLVAMTAALVGITVIATALSLFSPFILAFSVALTTFSVSMMAAGVGMSVFAMGVQAIAGVIPQAAEAITVLGTALIGLIPVVAGAVAEALVKIALVIVEYKETFSQAALAVIEAVLLAIGGAYVAFANMMLTLITGVLSTLAEHTPEMAKAGADFIIAWMTAISEQIPRIVDTAYKCSIALINGLADAIDENNQDLVDAVIRLMKSVWNALKQWIVAFKPVGTELTTKLKEGIDAGVEKVKTAAGDLIQKVLAKIKGLKTEFKTAAEDLLGGFVEGLKSSAVGQAVTAAAEAGSKIIGGLKSKDGLDEHSPSKKGIEAAEFLGEGVIIGLKKITRKAALAAAEFGGSTIRSMSEALTGAIDSANTIAKSDLTIRPVVSPVLDLSDLRSKAASIRGIIPQQSLSVASSIGIGSNNSKVDDVDSSETQPVNQFNFTQNNYSPKALREIDIYRQTKNALSMAR